MRSPQRLISSWLRRYHMRERIAEVSAQLSLALQTPVDLHPAGLPGGGMDAIFLARRKGASGGIPRSSTLLSDTIQSGMAGDVIASVRVNGPRNLLVLDEPELPRLALGHDARLRREATAYRKLAPLGLAPQLLVRGDVFLANEWLGWSRATELLKRSEDCLWELLPEVLSAVRRMHAAGVTHMDLNCGNMLVKPDWSTVAFIDFEYAPLQGMSVAAQQAFDYLRLAHNLLKPRRGLRVILQDPDRFVGLFAAAMSKDGNGVADVPAVCLRRIQLYDPIHRGFLGILNRRASVIRPLERSAGETQCMTARDTI